MTYEHILNTIFSYADRFGKWRVVQAVWRITTASILRIILVVLGLIAGFILIPAFGLPISVFILYWIISSLILYFYFRKLDQLLGIRP